MFFDTGWENIVPNFNKNVYLLVERRKLNILSSDRLEEAGKMNILLYRH